VFLWSVECSSCVLMGHVRFIVFYFLCGIVAVLTHIAFNWDSPIPSVGASGAIAGVLGAYLCLFPTASVRTLLLLGPFITMTRLPALVLIGFLFVTQFPNGLDSLRHHGQTARCA